MFALLMLACAPDEPASDFEGGQFQFTTTDADDSCYDGAFKVIFMPEDIPYDWESPVEIPGVAELPVTYDIDLQEPWTSMEVTVTQGVQQETLVVTGAQQTGVELDPTAYPDCLVDASVDVALGIVDDTTLQGTVLLHTSSFDEAGCPPVDSDPCDMQLVVTAARL